MAQHDDIEAQRLAKAARKIATLEESMMDKAISALAESAEGRLFLWWLLQQGRVGTQPFTSNALTTAFQCGELNIGNIILERIIRADPAIYVRLQQENMNARREPDPDSAGDDTADY